MSVYLESIVATKYRASSSENLRAPAAPSSARKSFAVLCRSCTKSRRVTWFPVSVFAFVDAVDSLLELTERISTKGPQYLRKRYLKSSQFKLIILSPNSLPSRGKLNASCNSTNRSGCQTLAPVVHIRIFREVVNS